MKMSLNEKEGLLAGTCRNAAQNNQYKLEHIYFKSGTGAPCVMKCKSVDSMLIHDKPTQRSSKLSKSWNFLQSFATKSMKEIDTGCESLDKDCNHLFSRSCHNVSEKESTKTRSTPCIGTALVGKSLVVKQAPNNSNSFAPIVVLENRQDHLENHPDEVMCPLLACYETSQGSESVICRICHSSGDDKLIAPCKCSGSTRYVHASCLVTWFKKSVKSECELCKSEVKIRKINHNLAVWRKPEDRPIPLIWFTVFFIGLFLNILSIYVNASEYCKSTACLIFYVVNGFGIILDAAFLWFWFLKCKHYWKKWCALNQDWFIDDLETDDEPQIQYVRGEAAV